MTKFYIKNRRKRVPVLALLLVLCLSLSACTSVKTMMSRIGVGDETQPAASVEPGSVVEPPAVSGAPDTQTQSPAPSTEPSPSPTEASSGPDLTARDAMTDDWFSDAAFMGNSLMDGFRLFSGLTTCDYYAATSMTVVGADSKACITLDNGSAGTLVEGLTQKPYKKIYILLGINEIGYDVNTFIDLYGKMLDEIIPAQPDCDIYIMGLTPVSAAKSAGSDTFNMTRINEYNTALRQLAEDKDCYYMDLVAALAGPDGYLPSSETTDGVHFSAAVYKAWLDYVKTHYA